MFFKLGFRNLLRNKRRTFISVMSIGMGLASLIIMDGFMIGMLDNMVKMTTSGMLGEGQIHHENFQDSQETHFTIQNLNELEKKLEEDNLIEAWTKRTLSLAMISSPRNSKNIMLYGIEVEKEKKVTTIQNFLQEGSFLKEKKGIVLGRKLFQNLGVRLGEKVVLTLSLPVSGELSQELFRVEGVMSFGSDLIDEGIAFIPLSAMQSSLQLGSDVHEIVLNINKTDKESIEQLPLWENYSEGDNLAQAWPQLAPGISAAIKMSGKSIYIVGLILFILVGIGIMNTLFMAIYERVFEFGVIRALGTKGREVILMVFYEGLALGIFSSIVGMIIAFILGGIMFIKGIDYGGIEYNNLVFQEPIYFVFSWKQWTLFPLITIIFTAVVGLYPAKFASKVAMGKSLKKTL